jgi:tRNA A37 threonylcarbamoyladenosine dehydratase
MSGSDFDNWQERTILLVGEENRDLLNRSHVLVIGLGGVGGFAAEALARAGVGNLTLVDGDSFHSSNRNRQIGALISTLGREKTEVFRERLLDINPKLNITLITEYLKDQRMVEVLGLQKYDYVIDAIDTLAPKVFLLAHCHRMGIRVVSSMGAGGKYDPTLIRVSDLEKSYECRLAYIVRKRLHRLGIRSGFPVVYSIEKADKNAVIPDESGPNKKSNVGTISYMPSVFGAVCASVVLRQLMSLPLED